MDLALSSRGRYALRAAVFLAAEYGSGILRTQQQVSDAMGVPRGFVPQVLSDLVRSGLVVSVHGAHGGYRLSRPPGHIRLLEVVEAGEGLLDSTGGVPRGRSAERAASCLQVLMIEAGTRFRHVLAATTLEHLVGRAEPGTRRPGSPPCGVSVASRPPSPSVRDADRVAIYEEVREEPVEGRLDRVWAPASPQRGHGDDAEDGTVDKEREQ
ncbi:MAG: Rrf2 family transcriptional regulator [Actinomycetota bacterium]|nr:Rrf2 family transcriptional regulator [Actinomycetota bacterium]